jgi:hypothetical protein
MMIYDEAMPGAFSTSTSTTSTNIGRTGAWASAARARPTVVVPLDAVVRDGAGRRSCVRALAGDHVDEGVGEVSVACGRADVCRLPITT